jgi:ribosomal protein L10
VLTKAEKTEVIEMLDKEFSESSGLYVTSYQGMTVEKFNNVRKNLKGVDAKYYVVKNTLAKKALEKSGIKGLADAFKGPVGVAITKKDIASTAKIIRDFNKDNDNLLAVRMAYADGVVFSSTDAERLANLPSRTELLSMLLSAFNAPATKLAGALSGVLTNFVRTVDAVRVKKDKE